MVLAELHLQAARGLLLSIGAPNASMRPTPNGPGDELEKFPDADAPLPIADASPPDAGMKSLDHCSCPPPPYHHIINSLCY
jgi:hypothetical protein